MFIPAIAARFQPGIGRATLSGDGSGSAPCHSLSRLGLQPFRRQLGAIHELARIGQYRNLTLSLNEEAHSPVK